MDEEIEYISAADFEKMKELGIDNPKEYRSYINNEIQEEGVEELLLKSVDHIEVNDRMPNIIVIDNFYNDPDSVRDFAMTRNYVPRGEHGAVGHRTLEHYHFKGVREKFESILNSKTKEGTELGGWDYQTNGVFQHCMAEDPFVIHADTQQWAAMVYLSPDAPVECGTSMYKHKETQLDRIDGEHWDIFKGNFYDETPFELVDKIGNKYNRCVVMDCKAIHAAYKYFGDSITNDRLFQIFFFDTEDNNE